MSVADSITNALLRFGRPMTLRRKTWVGDVASAEDVQVYGVTEGALSEQLVGGVSSSGEATVTFSNAQIVSAGWPGPPEKLDELVIDDGEVRTIRSVETKFLGTQVLVYVAKVLAINFDRLVKIERLGETGRDAFNEPIIAWSELDTVPASKLDLAGTENLVASQLSSEVSTRFRIPWTAEIADLSAADRIIYPSVDGDVYEIKAVKEVMLKGGFEVHTVRADG